MNSKLGIDVKAGDILVYIPKKPKKRPGTKTRVDILLVLSQTNYYEADVLMNNGTVGRFILRRDSNLWNPWDWTMSDWERM